MATNEQGNVQRRRRAPKPQPKNTAPEVVYTPPKPFNRNRLVVRLLTILAVVVATGMGLSIFFKVQDVHVLGTQTYSTWSVSEASGIEEGDSLLFFGRAGAAGKIRHQLPYIRSVRFRIKLPGTVYILVEESDVTYAIQDTVEKWWLLTSEGRVVEQLENVENADIARISGIYLQDPAVGELAVAAEETPADGQVIATTNADRLQASLAVCVALEANELLSKVSTIDATKPQSIEIWYGTQYRIKLGDTTQLDYKIAAAKQAISQMSQYQTGILDASFTTFPDKVSYMPFSK